MDFKIEFLPSEYEESQDFCDFIVNLSDGIKYWGSFYTVAIIRVEMNYQEETHREKGTGRFFWWTNMVIIKNRPTLDELEEVIQDLINRDELHIALHELLKEEDNKEVTKSNEKITDFEYVLEDEITDKLLGKVAFKVTFDGGEIFSGCFYTLGYLEKNWINGKYFWYPGMILLNELTTENIEIALNNLSEDYLLKEALLLHRQ